jgi:hypothetical protein
MTVAPTSLRVSSVSGRVARLHHGERANQWLWLGGGALFAFLVPFLFADAISVTRDVYYAIYSLSVFALFAAWIRASRLNVREFFARNWKWAVTLGLIAGGVLAAIVFKDTGTSNPGGATFPFKRGREHLLRTLATGALALVMAFGFTAVYHAGYSDFRSGKIGTPLRGTAMWSLPTLLTLNPLGAPIAHIGLHVSAVIHSYQTDTFLPPHT